MAQDVIRRVTVRGRSEGLDKVSADLGKVAAAQRDVAQSSAATATVTDSTSRRQLSASAAIDRLRASMDATYRAQLQMERGQRLVERAFEQGAIDAGQHAQMLTLLEQRFAAATAASRVHTAAMQVQGAATNGATYQMRNLQFQLFDVGQMLAAGQNPLMTLMQQGPQIAQIYGPDEGGIGRAFSESAKMIGGFLARIGPVGAVLAAIGVGVAGLRSQISEAGGAVVGFGDMAVAAWEMARDGLMNTLAPAIAQIAPWFSDAWEKVEQFAVNEFNSIARGAVQLTSQIQFAAESIGAYWEGSADRAKIAWSGLPAAMGDYAFQVADNVVNGIERMINKSIEYIDGMIARINAGLSKLPGGITIPTIGGIDLGGVENLFPGAAADYDARTAASGETTAAAIAASREAHLARMRENAATDYFQSFSNRAREVASRPSEEELEKSLKGASKAAKDLAREQERMNEQFMKDDAAARMDALSDSMARTAERIDTARSTARGFWDTFVGGVRNGEGVLASLSSALDNLSSKLMDMASNHLFDALFGKQGSVGGGILSSLFGGLSGGAMALGASGGAGLFAAGGYVSGPGSGTSDSIPARLSNGEYVINARATAAHRQLLDTINHGRRFAAGGYVQAPPAAGEARGGNVVINIVNQSGAQITTTERSGNGFDTKRYIDITVADKMARGGSATHKVLTQKFGAKPLLQKF